MKKLITYLCLIVLTFSLVSCSKISYSNGAIVKKSKSSNFSEEEIDSAIDCVLKSNGERKSIKKVYYNEERFNNEMDMFSEQKEYKENKGNMIILYGSIWTGSNNHTLPSNMLIPGWSWMLIRNDENSDWEIHSSGQC